MVLSANELNLDPKMKVLVTGHTGFKGTWLTLLLEKLGIEVCGLSLEPDPNSLYERLGRTGSIQEKFVDIRDFQTLQKSLNEFKPNIILHLAAQPLVLESYATPRDTFETNVMGTVNLLDVGFKQKSVDLISVITTDKVYKNLNEGNKFVEDDPLAGKDPYSASKVGTEAAVAAWRQLRKYQAGPKVISLRAGNVIGGGDFAEARLLPDLIRGFSQSQEVEIRNPESTRPWQHVLDPLIGYVRASSYTLKNDDIEAFNFAPAGESLSVGNVAMIAQETWGEGAQIKVVPSNSALEAETLQLNADLALRLLDWKTEWGQQDAVKSTVEWWLNILKRDLSPRQACEIDLNRVLSS
jgi:CDP-glucose 4,6-dehydratase